MFSICFLQPSNPLKILTLSLSGAITSSHFLIHRLVGGSWQWRICRRSYSPLHSSSPHPPPSPTSLSFLGKVSKNPCILRLNVPQCGCSNIRPMWVFKVSSNECVQMFTHCGCSNVHALWVFKCLPNLGVQIFNQCVCSNIHPMWVIKYSPNVVVQMFTQCGCSNDCPM